MSLRDRIVCSYGIALLSEEQKRTLLALVESRLPKDPRWVGHGYYASCKFDGETILIDKRQDETVYLADLVSTDAQLYQF